MLNLPWHFIANEDSYGEPGFANVISLGVTFDCGDDYEKWQLNYELVTGEELKIQDLFVQDVDMETVANCYL